MKSRYILTIAVGLAVSASTFGFDSEPRADSALVNQLEWALKECEWKARNLTGAPKIRMLMHKRSMDDVLEQLKAGREIDPRKLEEALKVHGS